MIAQSPTAPPIASRAQASLFHMPGVWLMLAAVFFFFSRIFDFALIGLHITSITCGLAFLCCVFDGGLRRAFANRPGFVLLIFYGWLLAITPFSLWIGGSLETLADVFKVVFPLFTIIAGLTLTQQELRRVFYALAAATLALTVLSFTVGEWRSGRIWLAQSHFGNPNDLAHILLLGLPFLWLTGTNPSSSPFLRMFAVITAPAVGVAIMRTGSRAGFLSAIVVAVLVLVRSRLASKLRLAIVLAAVLIGVPLFVPGHIQMRYFTFFSAQDEDSSARLDLDRAISSAHSRKELLQESIRITAAHPLMGVGPGMFAVAQNADALSAGDRGLWQVTHNTYTQISSECGIPALLLYLSVLVWCLRRAHRHAGGLRSYKTGSAELARMAFALELSLAAHAVMSFFASAAYDAMFPTLAALAIVIDRLAVQSEAAPPATPTPVADATPWLTRGLPRPALGRKEPGLDELHRFTRGSHRAF